MAKITIADIIGGFASVLGLNSRFQQIENELNNKVLYRNNPGSEANEMNNALDMNGKRIINLPIPIDSGEPARLQDLLDVYSGTTQHSYLLGLDIDDHPQYHNNARGDLRYLQIGGDVDGALVTDNGTPRAIETALSYRPVMAESFAAIMLMDLSGYTDAFTASFYVGKGKGNAQYIKDGVATGTPSTAYLDNSGFYDANGDGYKITWLDNVLQFGAYDDGTNASVTTTAINNACTYLLATGNRRGGTLKLPGDEDSGTYLVNATLNVPQSVALEGSGIFATRILADAVFADPYVVNLGDGRDGVSTGIAMFGCQLRHMQVDCADQAIIGVYSRYANEDSGLRDCNIRRSTTKNIHFDSSAGGVGVAQNWFMDNVIATLSASAGASAISIHAELNGGAFKGMNDITVTNASGSLGSGAGIKLDTVTGGLCHNLHLEYVPTGLDIVTSNGFSVSGVRSLTGTTDMIVIDATSQEFQLAGLNAGGATNIINHAATAGLTITQQFVGLYAFGAGNGTNNNLITSYSAATSIFRNLHINNFFEIPTAGELTIATGEITVTGSRHSVDTESDAASDDLDTINGGNDGCILIIQAADSARTVVAKDGTGNLNLAGDFTMDNSGDRLTLQKSGSVWVELSRSDNAA